MFSNSKPVQANASDDWLGLDIPFRGQAGPRYDGENNFYEALLNV